MAAAMLQTLLISLVTMNVLSQSQDLQLSMDRRLVGTDDVYGTVLCNAQGMTIKTAKLLLTRTLSGDKTVHSFILTASKPENDVVIDNLRINGNLKQNLATIQADMLERSQFDFDYFTCEVTYVKQSGQKESAFAMVGPGQAPNVQSPLQPDSQSPENVTQKNPASRKFSDVSLSELWFLGKKINTIEGKFQTLSERLDGEISRNTDQVKQRANSLENTVLQRVTSVETDISTRVSRLEDRLASILLSKDTDKDGVGSLRILEESVEKLTTLVDKMNDTQTHLLSKDTDKDGVGSLRILEERVEKLTTLVDKMNDTQTPSGWKGDLPTVCERGMGDDITKAYPPYVIMSHDSTKKQILCDTHTDGGGWLVFQRRTKGDEDFNRDWMSYREGFGSLTGDFWLGNEAIHNLTDKHPYELRIDIRINNGEERFARYSNFRVEDESNKYRLILGSYAGTAGNGMDHDNNMYFTTFDRDNDNSSSNCAVILRGAWWYESCGNARLNRDWGDKETKDWAWFDGNKFWRVSYTEMKIRRV